MPRPIKRPYLMYLLYGVHIEKVHANTRFGLDAGALITRSGHPGQRDVGDFYIICPVFALIVTTMNFRRTKTMVSALDICVKDALIVRTGLSHHYYMYY